MRIAHEIVEKNAGGPSPSWASTAAARISPRRLHQLVCDLLDEEVPLGDIDIAFYRDDVATRAVDPAVHASQPDFRLEDYTVVLVDDVLYTGRTVARRRSRRCSTTGAPRACSSPCWPTAATASCRSAPTTSARTCRPPAPSASTSASRELDGVDEVTITELEEAFAMRHLLSIEDLDRAGIERILDRAKSFTEVSEREIKKVPALRGRRVLNLFYEASTRTRARASSSPPSRCRADVINFASSGSQRREGRVAQGHGADAVAPTGPT